jgi:hypothetical protein
VKTRNEEEKEGKQLRGERVKKQRAAFKFDALVTFDLFYIFFGKECYSSNVFVVSKRIAYA